MTNPKKLLGNIAQLVISSSDEGKPLRGKKQHELGTLSNAAVLMAEGKIIEIGDHRHLEKLHDDAIFIDAGGALVMPGMIDPHTHLVFAGSREEEFLARLSGTDYLEHLGKGKGILYTVQQTRKAGTNELYAEAKKHLITMLRHGTTSCESKSGYGLDLETEIATLEVNRRLQEELKIQIPSTLLAAHAVPEEFSGKPRDYLEFIAEKILPVVAQRGLAEFMDVFCEKNVFDALDAEWILSRGKSYGLRSKIHTDEFFSIGGIDIAIKLNAVSADHLMQTSKKDMEKLSRADTVGVVLPGTSFNMGYDDLSYPRRLIDSRVPVAVGTDFNPGTCMCPSMQMMMELSVLKMHLTIEEAINACTVNAAFACGLQGSAGSIEIGKRADMVIYTVDNYKKLPYIWGINKVDRVIINADLLDFEKI